MTDEAKDKVSRGAVASCSCEARKYGVRSAMSLKAKDFPNPILNRMINHIINRYEKVMRPAEEYANVLEQAIL
jgi:DNA polymerase IV (archaeal DinB-like DNA polymerase)